jgi:hypothetical protein
MTTTIRPFARGRDHANFKGNTFEDRGDHTAIIIRCADGSTAETLIDTADVEMVRGFGAAWRLVRPKGRLYVNSATSRPVVKQIYLHRFIVGAQPGEVVDHINHNTLDNRRANLRRCSQAVNGLNRRGPTSNSTSGVRGVILDARSGKWLARVTISNKQIWLGLFDDKHEAGEAVRVEVARRLAAHPSIAGGEQ